MQIILYMAQTANGLIAGSKGETPWSKEDWESYIRICKKHKNLIVGHTTYNLMQKFNEFKKIGSPKTIVVTSNPRKSNGNITFVKSPSAAISHLKKIKAKSAIVGGGAKLNSSFIQQNLINEIYLDIEPIIFGSGKNFFEGKNFTKRLVLLESKKLSKNTIQLHYKIIK